MIMNSCMGNIPQSCISGYSCLVPVSYNYKCFTSPCFTVMFQKIILSGNKLAISAALESGQNTSGASSGAINFE